MFLSQKIIIMLICFSKTFWKLFSISISSLDCCLQGKNLARDEGKKMTKREEEEEKKKGFKGNSNGEGIYRNK